MDKVLVSELRRELNTAMGIALNMTEDDMFSEDDFRRTQLLHAMLRALELHPDWDACEGLARRVRELEGR